MRAHEVRSVWRSSGMKFTGLMTGTYISTHEEQGNHRWVNTIAECFPTFPALRRSQRFDLRCHRLLDMAGRS